jgi:N-acetylglucosamine malate deacetylase 2
MDTNEKRCATGQHRYDVRSGPLAGARSVLAVVAHPDDESFGLGAVLSYLTATGARCAVLCFTHGEASTLRGAGEIRPADLAAMRSAEFAAAARVLGLSGAELLSYPDAGLARVPLDELAGLTRQAAAKGRATHLLAFDADGVTGHPDHARATEAALAVATDLGLPVLGWTLPQRVARLLNAEFGTAFTGHADPGKALRLAVDRRPQKLAIECHHSQSAANPVLWRRLELLGDAEYLRILRTGALRTAAVTGRDPAAAMGPEVRAVCLRGR